MREDAVRFHTSTSWDEIGFTVYEGGVTGARLVVGDPDDETAPLVMRGTFPAGTVVPPHSHLCDYVEIILEGSQQVTRRWYHPGDIRIVKAGTVYGPSIAGPDGATVMVIFRDGNSKAQWVRQGDELRAV